MRIMSWNIRDGGACGKIEEVLESISKHNPDVLVLTEYVSNRRELLEANLRELGFFNIFVSDPPRMAHGVLVASKLRCKDIVYDYEPPKQEYRWKEVFFPDFDFRLLAVSVPEAGEPGRELTRRHFLHKLSEYCDFRRLVNDRVVITGDFATDAVDHYSEIDTEDVFHRSVEMGWRDPWQEQSKGGFEPSYYRSTDDCVGSRRDRTLVSPRMCRFDMDYRYLHLEREMGISDHSIQMLELRMGDAGSNLPSPHSRPTHSTHTHPQMLGYGKSAALYWAMAEKSADMLEKYGDHCKRPVVWFNPSFALGGKGSNAVGYFDGVVMGDSKLLILKGEWNGVGPVYEEVNIDAKTLERHEIFRWYILNWKLGYSWDYFVRDMGEEYTQHFNKKMPSPDRIMARKLEKMLNRIHSQLENIQDADIVDALLYVVWIREDEGLPDTKVFPGTFELLRYEYPADEEGPYIELPLPR